MSLVKPIAFYLPQFHPVAENSEWWGPGFTEWTNVAKAKPNFVGHYQPHIPRDLGFYDLRIVDNMRVQADLARLYGVHGFCFYYYWFNGRRILELPLNNYLASDIDFPFCVCWANENWTRTWDGLEKDVLLAQTHGHDEDRRFIEDILPLLKDPRAIKVDGKPMLLVYRADLFPDSKQTVARWRETAEAHGLPGLHLVAVQFYGITAPGDWGYDAAVEFPPHTFIGQENRSNRRFDFLNPDFTGGLVDYRKVVAQSMSRKKPEYRWYRGIVPSWDNTARRQNNSHALVDSSPELYGYWLRYLVEYTEANNDANDQILFINAWNEWGEGCHIEPDLKHGHAFLEATYSALHGRKAANELLLNDEKLAKMVGGDRLSALLDEHERLKQDNVLLANELRELALHPATVGFTSFKHRVGSRLRRYPLLFRIVRRFYRLFK